MDYRRFSRFQWFSTTARDLSKDFTILCEYSRIVEEFRGLSMDFRGYSRFPRFLTVIRFQECLWFAAGFRGFPWFESVCRT